MSNPPKQKGTAEETAIVNEWNEWFGGYRKRARRMPANALYDIEVDGLEYEGRAPMDVLMTRADRGERLVTIRFKDFVDLYGSYDPEYDTAPTLHIESKRYARFALHGIFFAKFGKAKK